MRLLAIILLGFLWCNVSAQVDPEQIYQAPGRDYVLLSTDTLNSSYPINGIYVPTRLRDSFYFKSDSICIGIFGDGRPDPCLLLPESGGGPSDTMYYWVFQVNGGTNDTIIQGEHINLVAGTNISITGGTDNPTINALVDTCFFSLSKLDDTTAALYDCNGTLRGTAAFSFDTLVCTDYSMTVSNGTGSDTMYFNKCGLKDTVVFYPPEVNDSYIDSSFVSYNPDSISIWLYRFDTSGLIDSFPIYLPRDSMDTDSQSLDLTGNTLSITRGNSVDLSGYLDDSDTYTDSASVWFNDTVIVFRFDQDHNLVDSFPIRIPKTSFIEHDSDWLEIPTYDVPFSVEDPIFSGSTTSKRLRIGQDSLETNFNVLINGGAGPLETASSLSANLWRQRSRSTNEFWDRAQQSGFLYFRGGDTDLGTNGIYLSMQQGYSGDSVLFSIANGQIGMRQYPNYRVDGDMDDVIALYYPDALGNLNIAPVDTMKRVLADWDFVHLQDGDTSYYSSNQRDSLLPLDTSSLDSLLWRPGIVRLGDTMFYKIAYDTGGFGGGFRQEYKPQFQIANKINAIDIYHWYYPYVWIRNDKADFWIRNHNNDNTVDTLPSFLEIGAESWYDSTGTEFTSDTSNRRILRISSQSNPGAFEIHRGSIKLGDYTPNDIDTSINSTGIEAVYVPKNDGTIALTSLDTLNAALSVAASTPNITFFDRYNTGDSIALNLNATPDTAFADLSWLKTTISNDTLFQGDDFYVLPQGADSLGTAFTLNEIIIGDGTRGGKSDDGWKVLEYGGTVTREIVVRAPGNEAFRMSNSTSGQDWMFLGTSGPFYIRDQTAGTNPVSLTAAAPTNSFAIGGTGQIRFGAYTGTTFDNTPTKMLGIDGSGYIRSVTSAALGTFLSGIFQPSGSYDNYSSWTAGSSSGTRVVTSGSQLDFFGEDSDISTRISGSSVLFSIPANAIQGSEISDATIEEVDLGVTNAPTDNWLLSYDAGSGGFTWVNPSTVITATIDIAVNNTVQANEVHEIDFRSTNGDITWSVSGTGEVDIDIPSNAIQNSEIQDGTIVATSKLSATGTPSSSTYLRGDNTWATVSASGDNIGINGNQAGNIVLFNASASPVATQDNDFYWDAGFNVLTMDDLVLNGNTDGTQNITASQALNITAAVGGVTIAGNSGNISIGSSGSTTITDDATIGANTSDQLAIQTTTAGVTIGHETNAEGPTNALTGGSQIYFNEASGNLYIFGRDFSTSDIILYAQDDLDLTCQSYSLTETSDLRLKKDIEYINNPYQIISALKPATFRYKEGEQDLRYGYIAQDYQKVFPDDVIENDEGYLSIRHGAVAPYTVAAVQQLIKDNQQQAAQIKVLTEQINKLYDIVNKKK